MKLIVPATQHAVIGVSANSDDETMHDALKAGFNAFMPKPFTLDLFNTTVIKVFHKISETVTTK